MTKVELFNHIDTTFDRCLNKIRAKNAGYNGDGDPLKTYRATELMGNCSTEQGIMSRIIEKMSRITTQLSVRKTQDEPIEETITDAIGCLAILLAYLDTKENHKS